MEDGIPSAPQPSRRRVHHRRGLRQFFTVLGPGVVCGAADNDPSGVVTYTQVGASTGFGLLWLMLVSTVDLYVLEEMSTRLAIVYQRGFARVLRDRFGLHVAAVVGAIFVASNVATLGADVAGACAALQLITGVPWQVFVVPFVAFVGAALVRGSYAQISRFLLLLTPIFLIYVVTGVWVHPPWGTVARQTFLPSVRLSSDYLAAALGLLGATLTPYMFFWQTDEEVEGHRKVADLPDERVDVGAGMVYANLIFYFIILTAAATLFQPGSNQLRLGTVQEAATALRPLLGGTAYALFGLALVASGIMAIPVMAASTAYLVAEVAGWREGLDRTTSQARGFYVVLLLTLAVGAAFAFLGINPVTLLFWSQVLNGALLPILFAFLLLVTSDRRIMGRYTNGLAANAIGWATVAATTALAILTASSLLSGSV
jgi:Mn2+/Fe2+ NRAMP family transporter